MRLGLCKSITAKQRIKPEIEEIASKIAILENEAARTEILTIPSNNQIYIFLLEMRECFDNAVWWDDGYVLHHE